MAERGGVGRATFDRVHEVIATGTTRSAAFKTVADETGRSAATVATAFYRVARSLPDGGGVKQRPRKKKRGAATVASAVPRVHTAARAASGVDALLADVHRSIDALGAHLKSLEADVARMAEIRRVLG